VCRREAMAAKTKTCYYEALGGLDRKCEAAEIKSAYRKLALKMHPDKAQQNGLSVEEATARFQQIQEAYSVLSDAHERAWYDAHREQILKGDDEPGEDPFKTRINLYKHFSSSCYSGFGDNAGGFFAVYSDLFRAIDKEEEEWEDADEDHVPMPSFGNSRSEWSDVSAFYKHWLDFCSRKAFGHADKWNPREAESRQVRRAMEQENKKARQAAKKAFNAEVRQLARFAQKRDPRVVAHQKQQAKESADKAQREIAEKERKKKAEQQDRQQRKEKQRLEEEARFRELQASRDARRARGEVVTDDESEESDEEAVEYRCDACRKSFKSEKAFDQHTKSKKHVQAVAKLRQQMEKELREEAAAAAENTDSDASDTSGDLENPPEPAFSPPPRAAAADAPPAAAAACAEASSDDGSENEDDFLARFAANGRRQPGLRSNAADAKTTAKGEDAADKRATDAGSSSDGDAGEAAADVEGSGSKKAQKRAKQKALLLAKSKERENVQELVKNCKKAQREEKKDGVDEAGQPSVEGDGLAAASAAGETEQRPAAGAETHRCAVCGELFPSRSKLFQHIKATGHAALKEVSAAELPGKGRKKKR